MPLWYNYYCKTLVFGSGNLNAGSTTEHMGFIKHTVQNLSMKGVSHISQVIEGFCVVKGDNGGKRF